MEIWRQDEDMHISNHASYGEHPIHTIHILIILCTAHMHTRDAQFPNPHQNSLVNMYLKVYDDVTIHVTK